MNISSLINQYGKEDSPYLGNLVNHLPMAQLALYKMTDDIEKVDDFTRNFKKSRKINPVKKDYKKIESLEECLGNRDLYEPCLDIMKKEIQEKGMEEVVTYVLNTYDFGMSSGLFHTLIRVAYSIEGLALDKELIEELERALAYYITAYREADLLTRKIDGDNIIGEMEKLIKDEDIVKVLKSKNTLGQKMKALYENESFLEKGFILKGSEKEKLKSLLNLLLPAYDNMDSIAVLHCITGLHALLVLKPYYKDFEKALDIMTTCILAHLLGQDDLSIGKADNEESEKNWKDIFVLASKSSNVHTLKFTYSCSELYKIYEHSGLKHSALGRIEKH